LTPGAKGKVYHPVKTDKRKAGARSRSFAAAGSREKASSTARNITPGYTDIKTLSGMNGLGSLYEQEDSIYKLREKTEEDKLFEINDSIRLLLESLGDKETTTEQENEEETQQKA